MLVTIIIPIYNVASYIEECLHSVMHQTYRELEVLLVDDCGSDESMAIARSMLGGKEDNVIEGIHYRILHHKCNRGLSAARNTGIDAANGVWLYFLDSDDWISDVCIDTLVKTVRQQEGIEMAVGQLETFDQKGNVGVTLPNGSNCPMLDLPDGIYTDAVLANYLSRRFYEMAWNKLIRRDFLQQHDLYFREGLIHEDTLWSFCCACKFQKIAAINQTLYHYRIRPESIMAKSVGEVKAKAKNTILCSQIDYVITHGLSDSKLAFDYLFPKIKGYFLSPSYRSNVSCARDLYLKCRAIHFWSYSQLWRMVPSKREFVLSLCRLLPNSIGIWFCRKMVRVLWNVE